jgi:hypothetical protein
MHPATPESFVDAARAGEFLSLKPRRVLELARAANCPVSARLRKAPDMALPLVLVPCALCRKRHTATSAITKGCAKSHPRRRRAVPRLRFGQDDVRFEFSGVRCGLPTIHQEWRKASYCGLLSGSRNSCQIASTHNAWIRRTDNIIISTIAWSSRLFFSAPGQNTVFHCAPTHVVCSQNHFEMRKVPISTPQLLQERQ